MCRIGPHSLLCAGLGHAQDEQLCVDHTKFEQLFIACDLIDGPKMTFLL